MNRLRLTIVAGCLLLDAVVAYAGASDDKQTLASTRFRNRIEVSRGLLTLTVEGVPLQRVLDEIARQSGISITIDKTTAETVTASLDRLPLEEGLTRILGARSAVFVYGNDAADTDHPKLVEIHVYPGRAVGADSTPPASPLRSTARRSPGSSPEDVQSRGTADRTLAGGLPDVADQVAPGRPAEVRAGSESNGEIRALSQALAQNQDSMARAQAASALGMVGGDGAVAPLAASIAADSDSAVREAAASALGKTWTESAVTPLAQALLEDRSSFVREAAARALGETWSDAAVDALARALAGDPRGSVREGAADALAKIGSEAAVDVLIAALDDANSRVRERAASALGVIGSRQGLGALIEISVTDRDPWVREKAERAAAKILRTD